MRVRHNQRVRKIEPAGKVAGVSVKTASHGRIDKRQAILAAAFTVFARQGYSQACVQEIAQEAGVAKPTVYNHLNDKENLFREAMTEASAELTGALLAAVEPLRDPGDDLRAALVAVGDRLLELYCDERSWALRRLLYAEVARFPELGCGVDKLTEALADRFARFSLQGKLDVQEPEVAAEQFLALLTGPMDNRTAFGTRPAPAAELHSVAESAVRTFLSAFAS